MKAYLRVFLAGCVAALWAATIFTGPLVDAVFTAGGLLIVWAMFKLKLFSKL